MDKWTPHSGIRNQHPHCKPDGIWSRKHRNSDSDSDTVRGALPSSPDHWRLVSQSQMWCYLISCMKLRVSAAIRQFFATRDVKCMEKSCNIKDWFLRNFCEELIYCCAVTRWYQFLSISFSYPAAFFKCNALLTNGLVFNQQKITCCSDCIHGHPCDMNLIEKGHQFHHLFLQPKNTQFSQDSEKSLCFVQTGYSCSCIWLQFSFEFFGLGKQTASALKLKALFLGCKDAWFFKCRFATGSVPECSVDKGFWIRRSDCILGRTMICQHCWCHCDSSFNPKFTMTNSEIQNKEKVWKTEKRTRFAWRQGKSSRNGIPVQWQQIGLFNFPIKILETVTVETDGDDIT